MGRFDCNYNFCASSLQKIYNKLPFIEKLVNGSQLLQKVSLYIWIKYLILRVGLCYSPNHSIFFWHEQNSFFKLYRHFFFLNCRLWYYYFLCIFHVKNVFLQIWRSNLRWNNLLPLMVKWSCHGGRCYWSIR